MEVDSGADVTVMHQEIFESIWPSSGALLQVHNLSLGDYHDNLVKILGVKMVYVQFKNNEAVVPLYMVQGSKGQNLLGRNRFSGSWNFCLLNPFTHKQTFSSGIPVLRSSPLGFQSITGKV